MKIVPIAKHLLGMSQGSTSRESRIQLARGVVEAGDPSLPESYPLPVRSHWIIGRELTLCDSVDLLGVPNALRQKALDQKIRSLSPFAETGRYVVNQGDTVFVWVWDERRRKSLMSDADHELQVLPESLLYPTVSDGERTIDLAEGCEIQKWSGGRLNDSVWYESQSGMSEQVSQAEDAWYLKLEPDEDSVTEELLWRSGVWTVMALIVFQVGNYIGWLHEETRLRTQIEEANLRAKEVVASRESAREELARTITLREWLNQPSQLSLVAEIDRRMPEGAEIKNWVYQDERLQVTVMDPSLDNRFYVEQLTSSPRFREVRIEPGATPDSAKIEVSLAE